MTIPIRTLGQGLPIPLTRRLDQLEENLGAADLRPADNDLAEIEAAASRIEIQGARYPNQLEQFTNR